LAVWYQAKAEAIAFFPPWSAMSTKTDGSRREIDTPWIVRMAKSCQGSAANTSSRDTALRMPIDAAKLRLSPTRSASAPMAGFSAIATTRLSDTNTPTAARPIPSSRKAYRGRAKLMIPKLSRERKPSATIAAIEGSGRRRLLGVMRGRPRAGRGHRPRRNRR
jgi:hypothetical protein